MIVYALRECIFSSVNNKELLTRLNAYADQQNKSNQLQIGILQKEKEELIKNQSNLISFVEKGVASGAVLDRLKELEMKICDIDHRIEKLIAAKTVFSADDLRAIKRAFVGYVTDECNEDTIAVLNDSISHVKVGDIIKIGFRNGIRVSPDTKKIFN